MNVKFNALACGMLLLISITTIRESRSVAAQVSMFIITVQLNNRVNSLDACNEDEWTLDVLVDTAVTDDAIIPWQKFKIVLI